MLECVSLGCNDKLGQMIYEKVLVDDVKLDMELNL